MNIQDTYINCYLQTCKETVNPVKEVFILNIQDWYGNSYNILNTSGSVYYADVSTVSFSLTYRVLHNKMFELIGLARKQPERWGQCYFFPIDINIFMSSFPKKSLFFSHFENMPSKLLFEKVRIILQCFLISLWILSNQMALDY